MALVRGHRGFHMKVLGFQLQLSEINWSKRGVGFVSL